jgi:hypothetical protein
MSGLQIARLEVKRLARERLKTLKKVKAGGRR